MDIRLRDLRVAARADGAECVALCDNGVLPDGDRAEMRQGDGVAVRRLDRDALTRGGNGAGEGHGSGHGRDHGRAGVGSDIHAPVLPRSVRMRVIEDERLQDAPTRGPRPRAGGGSEQQ
jgi:hypothetical protein